ncbi:LPXTG-motif cell wall anchor domain protein [Rothia mucilaginosa ATCC 25296]|uniref:LPXTG cell wall anchor domain-containing protein n=1 Tax=Rothia mucilaginosa TaxID=43675 RepID=UPI0001B0E7D9|nr:LPXTG cell wall anchor domain-containing protein [Rothia mucilaginosa]EET75700.1 LPXTG-motif cell wall anchor domain protein [Rothia mucilaginosa ATCC 25296]
MSKTTRRVYKIAAAAAFTAGSVAAIPATFAAEAPADQQQQVVDQKATAQTSSLPGGNVAEAPKAEATQAPKAEAPKTEAPKAEATEAPKAETPKAEGPKAEATEAPKAETPKAETPAPTAPATEAPKAETPKAETPKAEATEAPKAETPKAETPAPTAPATEAPKAETPAPTAPAAPEPTTPATPAPEAKQADPSVVIENAHFPGDAQFNTVSVVATGFYGEKVGPGVQVSIYALDANNQVTGDAIATVSVSADQIQDGSFKTAFTVEASKLPAGASYALVAVSNPQGQPEQKLVALSSFKVTESTSPKTETPKADETPAPVTPTPETPKADETPAPEAPKTEAPKEETPAPEAPKAETPKADETPAPEAPAAPENATLTTEDASLNPNDQYNVLTINGSGFTHESVAQGVQINIYRLDADGNITGEALATYDVPASEIMEGTFRAKVSILSERLQPGYAYAMVATSDPNGLVHQVAVTTAVVSDADHPAPTLPAATEGDNTTVRDNGDGTTSVFTAEMREDGSVVVTETRMPSSQAPKAKVGNASAATSSKGHGLSTSGYQGSSSTSSSSSKQQLAHTGAEGVAGIAGVGAAALIAGAALMLLRRRSL